MGQSLLMVLILFPELFLLVTSCELQFVSHCIDFMQQNLDLYSTPWNEFTGKKQILLSFLVQILSSGQMDLQVVASGRKLNLRRDLVGWPNGLASFLTSTRKSKKKHLKADISCITLANNRLMDVTQLALPWVVWPHDEKLALTCVQI